MKTLSLKPVKESDSYFLAIERILIKIFKEEIYIPLLRELNEEPKIVKNAGIKRGGLEDSLIRGQITFSHGRFKGRMNASSSRELSLLGAKWDARQGCFQIPFSFLPLHIQQIIRRSEFRFEQVLKKIDRKIAQILPEYIADQIKVSELFDKSLWKVSKHLDQSMKNIVITPKLTEKRVKDLSTEYEKSIKLHIKDFTKAQTLDLRQKMQASAMAGNRYETMIKVIQDSYNVSYNKAKFLARQETGLVLAKFKASRYLESGVSKYRWTCVAGSPNHPVRPMHKALNGTIQRWDAPPITDELGHKNNPGEDFNCRCYGIPIVEFRK